MERQLTLGQVANHFGCQLWHLQKLIEQGKVQERGRVGRYRMVNEGDLPSIRSALLEANRLRGVGPVMGGDE